MVISESQFVRRLCVLTAILAMFAVIACGGTATAEPTATTAAAPTAAAPTATTAAAPAATTAPEPFVQHGKLRVAFGSFGVESLSAGADSGVSQQQFQAQMYDQLLDFAPDGGMGPGLAESWNLSSDGLTYTFKIREDAEFHGGWGNVTAHDIAYSLGRHGGGPMAGPNDTSALTESILAVDDQTLEIKLNKLGISFIWHMSPHQGGRSKTVSKDHMVAAGGVESWDVHRLDPAKAGNKEAEDAAQEAYDTEMNAQDVALNEDPIGSGPWAMSSRSLGDSVTFSAVESHWRKTPAFAELEFVLVPEVATQVALFRSGDLDVIQVDADTAVALESQFYSLRSMPESTAVGFLITGIYRSVAQDKPTANPRVRYALNLAIDRQELLDVFVGGRGSLPSTCVTECIGAPWNMNPSTANVDSKFWGDFWNENLPYDMDKAKQILAEEGYPDGFSEVKAYAFPRGNAPWLPQLVEAIVGGWQELGVTMEIIPLDYGAYRPHLVRVKDEDTDDFNAGDITTLSTGMQFDPPRSMNAWMHPAGPLAMLGHDQPEFAELFAGIDTAVDPAERTRLVQEAMLIATHEWAVTPLFNIDTVFAVNDETVDPDSWVSYTGYSFLSRVYENLEPKN